jgi:hypothetical protein
MMDWIDIKETLPPANKPVLAFFESEFFKNPTMCVVINFDGHGVLRALQGGHDVHGATHWMQLPKKPQGKPTEIKSTLLEAKAVAMKNTISARIPECGDFGGIAQNLAYVCEQLGITDS